MYGPFMELFINGEAKQFTTDQMTVSALVEELSLPPTRIAVELNGHIVRQASRNATSLKGGDRLEIVTLVGGG